VEAVEPEAEIQPVEETETGEEPEIVEAEQEAALVEPEEVPPAPDKQVEGLLAAKQAETRQRQAIEAERDHMRRELEALRQQLERQQEPPPPPPNLWDDEQGWEQHFRSQVIQQADQLSRINASEMAARTQHADFQEKYELFNRLALENPGIVQQAMTDPHPWNRAYQIAANYQALQEVGATNIEELRAKIRAEVLAEAQANAPAPGLNLPPTVSTERSVASRSGPAWSGPRSIKDMLG
jgi:hypothetical protein